MHVSTLTVALLLSGNPALPGDLPPTAEAQTAEAGTVAPAPTPVTTPTPQPGSTPATMPTEVPPPIALPTLPIDTPAHAETAPPPEDDDAIVVRARPHIPPPKEDPLQALNMQSYAVIQTTDKVIVAPAAKTYSRVLPAFFRAGVRHFFSNLNEPIVFLNYLLQHKIGKAAETAGRFGLNSTVGAAGLVDVAKRRPFNLPQRRNGFANTMGFYGVKPGPFLFLPLVGPTTVRDLLGLWADKAVLPIAIGSPFNKIWYGLPSTIIQTLDYRVEFDAQLQKFHDAPNPYAASRAAYLESRQAEIDALHVHKHAKPAPVVLPPVLPPVATTPCAEGQTDCPPPQGSDQPR